MCRPLQRLCAEEGRCCSCRCPPHPITPGPAPLYYPTSYTPLQRKLLYTIIKYRSYRAPPHPTISDPITDPISAARTQTHEMDPVPCRLSAHSHPAPHPVHTCPHPVHTRSTLCLHRRHNLVTPSSHHVQSTLHTPCTHSAHKQDCGDRHGRSQRKTLTPNVATNLTP
jgi:hypothetical protein